MCSSFSMHSPKWRGKTWLYFSIRHQKRHHNNHHEEYFSTRFCYWNIYVHLDACSAIIVYRFFNTDWSELNFVGQINTCLWYGRTVL